MVDEDQVQVVIDAFEGGLHFSEFAFHAASLGTFFSSGSMRLSCEERGGSAEHFNGFSICITHRVGEAGLLNSIDRVSRSEPKKFILNEARAESAAVRE